MIRSSASMYALHASLFTMLLGASACREIKGQCSSRTDTLCLQIDLADRSTTPIPDAIALQIADKAAGGISATPGDSKTTVLPDVAATLSQRPYFVEIELSPPLSGALTITADATQGGTSVASAMLDVRPASAARPTLVSLVAPDSTNTDLRQPDDMPIVTLPDSALPADLSPANWVQHYSNGTTALRAISGTTSGGVTTIWAVGDNGLVVHGDGTTFAAVPAPSTGALSGVWAVSATTAWVCDRQMHVYYTINGGSVWVSPNTGATYPLSGIFGKSMTDVLVVGDSPTEGRHFDGTNWNAAPHALGQNATAVWFGQQYYYVVGVNGVAARSMAPELSWIVPTGGASATLAAVAGIPGSDLFPVAVGDSGTVQYIQPATHNWMSLSFPLMAASLTGVYAPINGQVTVVGASGLVYQNNNGPWFSRGGGNLANYNLLGIWGDGGTGLWVIGSSPGTPGAIFKY